MRDLFLNIFLWRAPDYKFVNPVDILGKCLPFPTSIKFCGDACHSSYHQEYQRKITVFSLAIIDRRSRANIISRLTIEIAWNAFIYLTAITVQLCNKSRFRPSSKTLCILIILYLVRPHQSCSDLCTIEYMCFYDV